MLYPVSISIPTVSSDVPESEDDSSDSKEGGVDVHSGVPVGCLQQVDAPAAASLFATTLATAAVSSSAFAVGPDVLSSLGVILSPESIQIIAGLFSRVNEFAKRFYNSMVSKQLPSILSDKLSLTGRAIWYSTYRGICEDVFVSMCICEYHTNHRPDFIHALPRIEVLSDSLERVSVPLIGDSLLGFLSRLDCAVRSNVESIFNSFWSEVSVSLEGEALNDISCGDFINVLDTAGIPEVALSVIVTNSTLRKEINRGTIKRTTSGIITASDHILSSWSHHKDGHSSYGLSSDPIVAERHTSSDNIPVSACDE
ncbi:hypothetical protein, partial [Candidatus Ichthyocystis hellenicum]|uniref:hypothetical protein n=1 Tax=Candidatus Ichthyocystis hellenicum TaxID=1561003 RepID=UPI001111B42B